MSDCQQTTPGTPEEQGFLMDRVFAVGVLPHEKLEHYFDNAFASSLAYLEAEQQLTNAYMDFDMDSSPKNADKILSALTNIEVEKAKIRYGIVHTAELTSASTFIGQVRHT